MRAPARPSSRADQRVRLDEHLFLTPDPDDVPDGREWRANLNPASVDVLTACRVEPSLSRMAPERSLQFERLGYVVVDPDAATAGRLVFNRTVTLKDTWARIERRDAPSPAPLRFY